MKILIIQTAFIGDVILATPVIEQLQVNHPNAKIDFLLRAGNESLLANHPYLNKIIVWNKKKNKLKNLFAIIADIRESEYDYIINLHRFSSSGLITFLSGAKNKIGFDKNPFAFCYTQKVKHDITSGKHEVERNLELLKAFCNTIEFTRPKLYPSEQDFKQTEAYKQNPYICIAPTSVWFTKQFPAQQWIDLTNNISGKTIYLLGAPSDFNSCEQIKNASTNKNIINLSGKLSFLQSAALMKDATMNYVNDSAPLHIASAMNAPVTAVFCSTTPTFGFGPLSANSKIVESKENLSCKPCGLHGYKACPQGHFKCATTIKTEQLI